MAALRYFKRVFLFCSVSLFSIGLCQIGENKCEVLDNCFCNDDYIYCNGHEFQDIQDIYQYINTEYTYRISVTGGKLSSIPADLFASVGDQLEKITYLNFSGNGIEKLESGAFDRLPNLVTLDLSDNSIPIGTCDKHGVLIESIRPLTNLKQLNLRGALCKDSTMGCDLGNLLGNLTMAHLENLDLSNNGFSSAGPKFETFMDNAYSLTHLNLSHNDFTRLVYGYGFDNIVDYDFSYNKLITLSGVETDEIEAMPLLKNMRLGGNPFHCDCYMNAAYDWFNKTKQPVDIDDIICEYADDNGIVGKPIMDLDLEDFCGEPQIVICYGPGGPIAVARSTAWVIVLAAVVLILVAVISVVLVVKRRRRRNQHSNISGSASQSGQRDKNPAYSRMI